MVNGRTKGHTYERNVAQRYREIFSTDKIQTARYASREMDDLGVDIVNVPYLNPQCKSYRNFSGAKAIQTLKEMPPDTNINILHLKITRVGACVVLLEDDRYNLCKNISESLSKLDD